MKPLAIAQNVSLRQYSTMKLGGTAAYATGVYSAAEVREAYKWASSRDLPCLMIGSGSNIVWKDEGFDGLLIVSRIPGFDIVTDGGETALVSIGAGESWDQTVSKCCQAGLTGIEALSLIPGTAGGTPIQNVGAYGQEIAQTLFSVQAYDSQTDQQVTIGGNDCDFAYRTSRFKEHDRGRFFITGITLKLAKGNPQPPFYAGLQKYFDEHNVHQFTPQVVREAVIAIRQAKLPDPNKVANNGSFFGNPIVDKEQAERLLTDYPDMPHWPTSDGTVKLSAAWLLEQAGFKGVHDAETGMATWATQPLVLVNESARSTADLLIFKKRLLKAVAAKFNVKLEQEPELLPDLSDI